MGFPIVARLAGNFGAVAKGLAAALAALSCAAMLAGCGGGEAEPERRTEPPKIPSAVADELAERSEAVAEKIEAGDVCGAAHEADALEDRVEALIAAGDIPRRYQDELRSEAIWLRDNVNCPQAAPPPPEEKEEDEEKKEEEDGNKGKGNGDGEGDGDGAGTLTVETVVTLEDGG
jgi:hypothetical protein